MVKITDYLDPRNVAFLEATSREEALSELVALLDSNKTLEDKALFYEAVCDREKIVSTGIGMGVAIPHAKLAGYRDFFIGIGILSKGVDWDSMDGTPVRLIFLIGGPDNKQTEYLKILSSLTQALKDEERRKKILNLKSIKEIVKLFADF